MPRPVEGLLVLQRVVEHHVAVAQLRRFRTVDGTRAVDGEAAAGSSGHLVPLHIAMVEEQASSQGEAERARGGWPSGTPARRHASSTKRSTASPVWALHRRSHAGQRIDARPAPSRCPCPRVWARTSRLPEGPPQADETLDRDGGFAATCSTQPLNRELCITSDRIETVASLSAGEEGAPVGVRAAVGEDPARRGAAGVGLPSGTPSATCSAASLQRSGCGRGRLAHVKSAPSTTTAGNCSTRFSSSTTRATPGHLRRPRSRGLLPGSSGRAVDRSTSWPACASSSPGRACG